MGPFEPIDTEEEKRKAEMEEDAERYRKIVKEIDRIIAVAEEQMIPSDANVVPDEWGG